METTIKRHPSLLTTFAWNADGEIMQSFHPEVFESIHVEHLSEFEFRFVKDTLVYPYKIVGGKLYRCRVFETEKAGYVFFDVHHTVFDGTSFKVFMSDVDKAYRGMEGAADYYYLMLRQRENAVNTEFYEESRKYFEDRYEGIEWSCYPVIDNDSRENEMGELVSSLGIEQPQMNAVERAYKISRNEFFITVAALAISIYNNAPDIKLSWIYNGRENSEMMTTVGLLFRDLPVALRFHDDDALRSIFADVHEQVRKGIEHSCYPYVESRSQAASGECAYSLYQQNIRDMRCLDAQIVDVRQNQAASQTILDIQILDSAAGPKVVIDYAASWYEDASIDRFKDIYIRVAQALATHNSRFDMTIGEIRSKLEYKENFFENCKGFFSRKK
jgi:hypothetical protein